MSCKESKDPTSFPHSGLVRLKQIIAPNGPIPVARSTWWAGVKAGRFPRPLKISERVTAWHAADVRKLFERGDA
jgi:prophage regulatory protein